MVGVFSGARSDVWYQIAIVELLTHRYKIGKLCHPTDCPMMSPYENSPSGEKLKNDKLLNARQEFASTSQWPNAVSQCNRSFCSSFRTVVVLTTAEELETDENPLTVESVELPNPILLTDCCSLFSSILRLQPNSQERCSRIIMAHLRDLQSLLTISFADASVNLSDVGAKHGGNNNILRKFLKTGRFIISFVGRKAREPPPK